MLRAVPHRQGLLATIRVAEQLVSNGVWALSANGCQWFTVIETTQSNDRATGRFAPRHLQVDSPAVAMIVSGLDSWEALVEQNLAFGGRC
jgi:hypothetical protein